MKERLIAILLVMMQYPLRLGMKVVTSNCKFDECI